MNILIKAAALLTFFLLTGCVNASQVIEVNIKFDDDTPVKGATIIARRLVASAVPPGNTVLSGYEISDKHGKLKITLEEGNYSIILVPDRCSWKIENTPFEVSENTTVLTIVAQRENCKQE